MHLYLTLCFLDFEKNNLKKILVKLLKVYLSWTCKIPTEQKILIIITGAHTDTIKGILSVIPKAVEKFFK